tara:strand:+ start:6853 stop:7782 length:930 start_codon:yes stop_codon:yes gene_type:complete
MNVIAITIYNKPDLLYLYLEQLEKSGELKNYKLRLHTEEGYDPEENVVIEDFKKRNPDVDTKLYIKRKINCPLTGFHNILSSYTMSAIEADEFVIIGEEDMLPTEDYLRFNRVCYEKYLSKYDRIFAIAHKRRPEVEQQGYGDVLIGDYQLTSPSCISVKAIDNYITPYLQDELFFSNPIAYNMQRFNNLRIAPHDHTHHDGALERMMLANNLFALKPDQARSMHVGLSGIFCRGNPPQGTLEERVAQWRELIKDGDKLRSLSTIPSDIVVTNPQGPYWEDLKLDTERNLAKASTWFYDDANDFKDYIK